ncbi:MAG: nuclear transport factor 2 family protein [Cyclobacteriaceae bacterium]
MLVLAVLSVSFLLQTARAQSAKEAVQKTIEQLFDGMRSADSAMVRQAFAPQARMLTIVEQSGSVSLQEGSLSRFLEAIGTPHEETWDERIGSYEIHIDDNLATAWTPYQFYRGATFSHCGVNAFQLYRSDEGWKIIQVTDTRRKEDCVE